MCHELLYSLNTYMFVTLFSVPTGYYAIFNATHYEFDINVYSPVGTVVFEALILVENPDDVSIVLVDFQAGYLSTISDFEPFSINRMGNTGEFYLIFGNVVVTVTTDQILVPYDTRLIYQFQLSCIAVGTRAIEDIANIILYEIGELKVTVSSACMVLCHLSKTAGIPPMHGHCIFAERKKTAIMP